MSAILSEGRAPAPESADATIRRLLTELNVLRGVGQMPQRGCHHARLPLDIGEALVEYEYEAGEDAVTDAERRDAGPGRAPAVTILNVFLNGMWVSAEDCIAPGLIERWTEQLIGEHE